MKGRFRRNAKKVIWVALLMLGVATGVLCLPREVEGAYSAGQLIQCLCDSSHYLRFHNGMVSHYSTNHEPAELFGRYEVKSDGSVDVYLTPLRAHDPETLLFTLGRPRIGFAVASSPGEDQSFVLVRLPVIGTIASLFAQQDVKQVTIPEETLMVTTFYDSSLAVVRKETQPIKARNEEQTAAGEPAAPPREGK